MIIKSAPVSLIFSTTPTPSFGRRIEWDSRSGGSTHVVVGTI